MQMNLKIEGGHFGDKKVREKSHSAEKSSNPIVSSGFVSNVQNGINEKGTLCTNLYAFWLSGPVVW